MNRFVLVRHASAGHLGRFLAGRLPGIQLSEEGRTEASALALRLADLPAPQIVSSPLERARETADAIARPHGATVEIEPAFTELEFGAWTGRSFDELESRADWHHFNQFRAGARPPGGETMLEAQARAVGALLLLRDRGPSRTVVVVSHADVLRAVLLHFLGMPLDHVHRLELAPASVSILELGDDWTRILTVNASHPGVIW